MDMKTIGIPPCTGTPGQPRKLSQGSAVFVEAEGFLRFLPGIVWYRGILPPRLGIWFGVELIVSTRALK